MIQFSKQKNKGFTLVETLIAISIFSMSIVTMMSVLGTGISDTNYAKTKIIATYLAQEGIEHARNIRDNYVLYASINPSRTWDTFKTTADISYPITDSDFSIFHRAVQMIPSTNTNEVIIYSTVTWTQKSVDHSIVFSENLFNWVE
jgi:prepilin-type N-terminal cleavage/methylation domain-containing protein